MILTPASTATTTGRRAELAVLRTELSAWMQMLKEGVANVSTDLEDGHKTWSALTPDLEYAQRHIDSAWRSLGHARDIIEGK